jgi:diguanylate cyclase (GGDEF)-like protein
MDSSPPPHAGASSAAGLDKIRLSTSSFLAVLVLVGASIVASTFLSTISSRGNPHVAHVRAIEALPGNNATEQILTALSSAPSDSELPSSRDPRNPIWMEVTIPSESFNSERIVEISTLRLDGARFWRIVRAPDGSVSAVKSSPSASEIRQSTKGGYSIRIPDRSGTVAIVGELRHYVASNPRALIWDSEQFLTSELVFERQGGALFGSLLILAAFSTIVAVLNRDITFLIFSGWIVAALRVAAINAGWDRYWIGLDLPIDTYHAVLRISIAAYGFFTVALFRLLLLQKQPSPTLKRYFRALQYSFLGFVLAAPFIEHVTFFESFWLFAAFGLGTLTLYLGITLVRNRTRVAASYSLSWGAMIAGMASEIAAQSGALTAPHWLNSQSASVVSALIMGLALADRLKTERDGRLVAQARSVQYLKKYEQNYNSMPIGLFGLAPSGHLKINNPAFAVMFGLNSGPESSPKHIDEILGLGVFERLLSAVSDQEQEIEASLESEQGHRWYLVRFSSRESSIEGSVQDVTLKKIAEEKLKHLVDHDSLTGVLNRRGLEAALRAVLQTASSGKPCAIAYVDLDRFKLINDLHGHATGDALLQQTAKRLLGAVRNADKVARLADSFIVLFVDCPDYATAGLTERIRAAIGEEPFAVEGKGLNMTASIGVVAIDPMMNSVDSVAAADRACAEAKARGRNCVVKLSDQDAALQTHLEELRVVADLQQRIPTDKYFLEFQPIVALRHPMASLSYEVLIRMRGDDGRVVPPGKFIGAAERNGLMSQIDRWVLRNTLEWLDGHPSHRDRMSFATINISGASLNDTRFVDDAFSMIAEHPLAMPKLCFEITESVALHDLGSTRRFVDRVRMYGSKLALDDFGAGYTSFNYLKEIPADFIKIDGSFVKDINRNPANYAITRTIVELTHELGMRSIAEWAETPDTIASLYDLGVDYGQGFALARPLSSDVISVAESGGALVFDPQVIALLTERGEQVHMPRQRFTNETRVV